MRPLAAVALLVTSAVALSVVAPAGAVATPPVLAGQHTVSLAFEPAAIACAPRTDCLAVGDDAGLAELESFSVSGASVVAAGSVHVVSWTTAGYSAVVLTGVACQGDEQCVVVGYEYNSTTAEGVVLTVAQGDPGPVTTVSGITPEGVACETAATCVVVGSGSPSAATGAVVDLIDGNPGTVHPSQGTSALSGVACPAADLCYAAGQLVAADSSRPIIEAIDNGIPGKVVEPAFPGYLGAGSWGYLNAISCTSTSDCTAVGQSSGELGSPDGEGGGIVVSYRSGTAQLLTSPGGPPELDAVACPTAGDCLAVGENFYQNGRWSGANGPGGVVAIAGTPGLPESVGGTVALSGVVCPSSALCLVAGRTKASGFVNGGVIEVFSNTGAPTASSSNGKSCPGSATSDKGGDWADSQTAAANPSTGPISGIYATIQPASACYDPDTKVNTSPTSAWVMLQSAKLSSPVFVQAGIFYPNVGQPAHLFVEAEFPDFPSGSGQGTLDTGNGPISVSPKGETGVSVEFPDVKSSHGQFAVEDLGKATHDRNCPGDPANWQGKKPSAQHPYDEVETTYNGKCLWIFYLPDKDESELDQWADLAIEVHARHALPPGTYDQPAAFEEDHLYYHGHWRNYFSDYTGNVANPAKGPTFTPLHGSMLSGTPSGEGAGCQEITPPPGSSADLNTWAPNEKGYCYPWEPAG